MVVGNGPFTPDNAYDGRDLGVVVLLTQGLQLDALPLVQVRKDQTEDACHLAYLHSCILCL